MKLHTSVFIPVVTEVIATPIASAELEIKAIALSLLIIPLSPIFNNIIANIVTPGIAMYNGDEKPKAAATVNTPNPTCDSPISYHTISF